MNGEFFGKGVYPLAEIGRPTKVEVNLQHIRQNLHAARQHLYPGSEIMAVVKADGYGHGAVAVAKTALHAGAAWIGVALAEEGVVLRKNEIDAPILILGYSSRDQIRLAISERLDITVYDMETLDEVRKAAAELGREAAVHVKVDTGMGRLGIQAEALDESWLKRLTDSPRIWWRGLFSHLAESEAEDPAYTRRQLSRFLDLVELLRRRDAIPPWLHLANSGGTFKYPGTHFNMVRFGLGLYGLPPYPAIADALRPALSWTSQVAFIKRVPAGFPVGYGRTFTTPGPMQLAGVPVGYADGYRRGLSNRASVLIRGRRYPVVGRISMDQMTVAIPPDHPVARGDTVTLIGEDGTERITADELAEILGTISYEVVCGIGTRVPRFYTER